MTLPRLAGERVTLVPMPYDVAVGVLAGDTGPALAALGLRPGEGWPHDDTPDAARGLAEHGRPGDDGPWLVVLGEEVIGDCGWLGGPDEAGDAELGYGLAAPYRGRGLGAEAVALLAGWAERRPGVRRLTAEVLPGNEPSQRLLRSLGFAQDGYSPPYVRYVRPVPGWTPSETSG